MKNFSRAILVGSLLVLFTTGTASAQIGAIPKADCDKFGLPCTGTDDTSTLLATIRNIINIALSFVGVIALAVLIWSGVSYIISLGDDAKVGKAKKMILYSIVGLLVIGLSAIVVNFIIILF